MSAVARIFGPDLPRAAELQRRCTASSSSATLRGLGKGLDKYLLVNSTISSCRPPLELVEALLSPGVIICCFGDVPPRTGFLQQVVAAAGLAEIVAPRPTKEAAAGRTAYPNHFIFALPPSLDPSQVLTWMTRVESTYDEKTGAVDSDAMHRNHLKIQFSSLFLSVRTVLLERSYEDAVKLVNSSLAAVAPQSGMGKAKLEQRLAMLSERMVSSTMSHFESRRSQWTSAATERMFESEFQSYVGARMTRLSVEEIRARFDSVQSKCERVMESDVLKHEFLLRSSQALERILLEKAKMEEQKAALEQERATAAAARLSIGITTTESTDWLTRYVSPRYHFWFSRTGLTFIVVFFLFLLSGIVRWRSA